MAHGAVEINRRTGLQNEGLVKFRMQLDGAGQNIGVFLALMRQQSIGLLNRLRPDLSQHRRHPFRGHFCADVAVGASTHLQNLAGPRRGHSTAREGRRRLLSRA